MYPFRELLSHSLFLPSHSRGQLNIQSQSRSNTLEKQPFIEFNISEKRLHGNAGCNIINGGFQVDKVNPMSISFPQVISTMMACPDMEVESRVLKALNSAQSFGKLSGGGMGLYDANDNLVMVLVRK